MAIALGNTHRLEGPQRRRHQQSYRKSSDWWRFQQVWNSIPDVSPLLLWSILCIPLQTFTKFNIFENRAVGIFYTLTRVPTFTYVLFTWPGCRLFVKHLLWARGHSKPRLKLNNLVKRLKMKLIATGLLLSRALIPSLFSMLHIVLGFVSSSCLVFQTTGLVFGFVWFTPVES